MHYFNKN
jgi:hAT family C-terminal dimerisation region